MIISSDATQRREASRGNGTTGGQFGHQQHSAPAAFAGATVAAPDEAMLATLQAGETIDFERHFDADDRVSIAQIDKFDADSDVSHITVIRSEVANWDERLTAEQIKRHEVLITDAYVDWFDAAISGVEIEDEDADHPRLTFDVNTVTEIPDAELTEENAFNAAWATQAKFRNETDPGTFGSEYIGNDISARIETAENPHVRAGLHEWNQNRGHANMPVSYRADAVHFRDGDHLIKIDRDGRHWRAHIPLELNNAHGREFDQAEADGKYEWTRHLPAETAARTNGITEGA